MGKNLKIIAEMLEKEPNNRISSSVVVKRLTSLKVRHKKPSQKNVFLTIFMH